MGEEAAVPLLVGNDDVHLDLTLALHGDGDGHAGAGDRNQQKGEEVPAAAAAATHALLSWDWSEVAGQLAFAAPMVATSMAYYAIPLVSVMYAGRLGDLQLAAATLGNSWGTVTGIALMVRDVSVSLVIKLASQSKSSTSHHRSIWFQCRRR